MTKVAAIQMISTAEVGENLQSASELIDQAVEQGANFLLLPENFPFMGHEEHDKVAILESFGKGPIQDFLSEQSQKHGIWLMGGTIPLQASDANKVRPACLLYDPQGKCTSRYDKIHLFDVTVDEDSEESYQESNTLEAGDEIVVAKTPFGNIGMSICYDLRFPELYRAMHKNDVNIIRPRAKHIGNLYSVPVRSRTFVMSLRLIREENI